MKRLTEKHYKSSDGYYMKCSEHCENSAMQCGECDEVGGIIDRLGTIEDIIGDEYDLSRLRELVKADREGRCVVLPCKVGTTVYSVRHERVPDDDYRMSFHIECSVVAQKFGLIHADCIGKTVFLTREAAEATLKGEQDGKEAN